jgi:hypothetical protein
MLEGHCWQARRARAFLAAADVDIEDATGRPNSKLVEGFFNRLWAPLSLMPGNVGRYRGEQLERASIYIACRNGRKDPRKHFPELNQALDDIAAAIHYLNTKPVHSTAPNTGGGSHARCTITTCRIASAPVAESLWMHAAPVVEERTVRRGMVQVTCPSPFGESFTYHFAEENLYNYEGRKVRMYFDPWGDLSASIQLLAPYRGTAAGTIIAQAVCIEDAPQIRRTAAAYTVELNAAGRDRALAMRKAQRHHIRREHRAIETDGKALAGFATDIRATETATTIQSIPKDDPWGVAGASCPGNTPPQPEQEDWRESTRNQRLAEADRIRGQSARRRGEILTPA